MRSVSLQFGGTAGEADSDRRRPHGATSARYEGSFPVTGGSWGQTDRARGSGRQPAWFREVRQRQVHGLETPAWRHRAAPRQQQPRRDQAPLTKVTSNHWERRQSWRARHEETGRTRRSSAERKRRRKRRRGRRHWLFENLRVHRRASQRGISRAGRLEGAGTHSIATKTQKKDIV